MGFGSITQGFRSSPFGGSLKPFQRNSGTGVTSPSLLSQEQEAALNRLMPQLQSKINPDYAAAGQRFDTQIQNPAIDYMNTVGMQGIASRGSLHSTANQNAAQELGDNTMRGFDVQRGQAMENERQGSKGYIQALLGALGTKTKENILDKKSFTDTMLGGMSPYSWFKK